MRILRKVGLTAVALMVLLAPLGQAQDTIRNPNESTPTTLYFHIFDTINRFVINTQPMDAEFFDVGGANFPTTPSPNTGVPGTGLPINEGWDMNTIYGYSTAGPVEYDFIENGRPRFHPERGIAATVEIDDTIQPVVYMYFDVRDLAGSDQFANALPEFNVRINLQEGDNPGLDANLDEGRDIMSGTATFHLADFAFSADPGQTGYFAVCDNGVAWLNCGSFCSSNPCLGDGNPFPDTGAVIVDQGNDATRDQTIGETAVLVPDEFGIVEVLVPLTVHETSIPKKEAYNVRVDWYQTDPSGQVVGEDEFTTGAMRLAADGDHLTRLEMNIFNPIYFSFIHPQVAANTLLIHAGGNSPWGTYDVDIDAVTIEVVHESGKKVPDGQLKKLLNTNEHVHGLHDEDTQMTYLWDFRDHNAALGEYTIKMGLTNDANSQWAHGEAKFIVSETEAIGIDTTGEVVEPTTREDEVDTPAAGMVPAIALLGVALLLARRRLNA